MHSSFLASWRKASSYFGPTFWNGLGEGMPAERSSLPVRVGDVKDDNPDEGASRTARSISSGSHLGAVAPSAVMSRPPHQAITDVRDVLSRRRFGQLDGVELGKASHASAHHRPGRFAIEELRELTRGKRLVDPLEGLDDLHIGGMEDSGNQRRPAEPRF